MVASVFILCQKWRWDGIPPHYFLDTPQIFQSR